MNTECGCVNIVSSPVSIVEETRLDTGENIETTPVPTPTPPARQVRTQRAVQQRRIQPRSTPNTSSGSGY